MDKLETEASKKKDAKILDSVLREYIEKYEEVSHTEICNDASELTKSQKEWANVRSVGRIK